MTQPNASANVVADAAHIGTLGTTFVRWSQDIDRLVGDIKQTKITPGHGPNAAALRERYDLRVGKDYVAALENLGKSLYAIGSSLGRMATVYANAEDLNKDDVARLDGLLHSVGAVYPNLNAKNADLAAALKDLVKD